MDQNPPLPTPPPGGDAARRRRSRSWAILIALIALVALFYAISIVKLANY